MAGQQYVDIYIIPCFEQFSCGRAVGLSDEAHCRYHVLGTSFIGRRLGGIGHMYTEPESHGRELATVLFSQTDCSVRCVRDGLLGEERRRITSGPSSSKL